MTDNAAGLSFEEAFEQAQEETGFVDPVEEAPTSPSPVQREAPQAEQPAVENDEGVNLFADPESNEAKGEQHESDSYAVTVNGVKTMVSLDELTNGYQRQADYTQGTQENAQTKKEHNNAITLWDALEEDYAGTVQKLMARTGIQGKIAAKPDKDMDALIEEKLAEKLAADPRLQELENENSLRQLNVIFAQIEKEYSLPTLSNPDKQHILEKAQEWETNDLSYVVYRLMQLKNAANAQTKNVELVSSSSSSGPSNETAETPVEYYSTVSQAWEASLAEEGNTP